MTNLDKRFLDIYVETLSTQIIMSCESVSSSFIVKILFDGKIRHNVDFILLQFKLDRAGK